MPIKIHHGPPGSFKTAGAVADDFLREAKAGRVIVTNVRGVSRDRTMQEFPDLPESFDVIFVDDKTEEGRKQWAAWFHWVPLGAFILVDEVQDIWPKRWRDADLRVLDYPGGVDKASAAGRPKDWEQAFDKHRHYNWDMTLTTPSYAKVRDDVKGVADMAYKHKDLGLLGFFFRGSYVEGAHAADDTGKSEKDFYLVSRKKVPPYVFKLYDSTQTGVHSQTASGFNVFKSPRFLILFVVLLAVVGFVSYLGRPRLLGGPDSVAAQTAGRSAAGGVVPVSSAPGGGGSAVPARSDSGGPGKVVTVPFEGEGVYVVASFRVHDVWKYAVSFAGTEFTNGQLLDMGYSVRSMGGCAVELRKDSWHRVVTCGGAGKKEETVMPPMAGGLPVGPV